MQKPERLYYFDFARALLMFVGVPYHVARIYGDARSNLIQSVDTSRFLHIFAEFTHSFRMEAFFIVSGFFAIFILRKRDPLVWIKDRFFRIVVPLISCTILFLPIINFARYYLVNPDMDLAAYLAFCRENLRVIVHLWFLYILWGFSCICCVAALWIRQDADRAGRLMAHLPVAWPRAGGLFTATLLGVAFLFGLYLLIPVPLDPFMPMFFIRRLFLYLPYFAFGALLALRPCILEGFLRFSWGALLLAPVFAGVYVWVDVLAHEGLMADATASVVKTFCGAAAGLFWAQLVLATGYRFFNRPNRLVRYLCDAALCVYLFHLPIAWLLALPLMDVAQPPVIEWLVLVCGATALSLLVYEVVRRFAILAFLFNGESWPRAKPEQRVMPKGIA